MFRQFEFEKALYAKLERVPVSTQFKLEMMGLEIPAALWDKLALPERWVLCHIPIRSKGERECYYDYLAFLLRREGFPAIGPLPPPSSRKAWEELSRLPAEVAIKMRELNLPLFWPEWIKLDDMERYTVYKLCREKNPDSRIKKVVQEFLGLSPAPHPASR